MNLRRIQAWLIEHKRELAGLGAGLILAWLFWAFCLWLPKPRLVNPPMSSRETTVQLSGTAKPFVSVVAYNASGTVLMAVDTGEKGEFVMAGLPVSEGETVLTLRAVNGGWRASFPLRVRIKKDTAAPQLQVDAFENSTVTGSNTTLSGKAEPGSTVTVNGVKTTVSSDGTWTATVALQSGPNSVTVTATDPAGNTTTHTQTIQYTPSAPSSPTGVIAITETTSTVSAGSLPYVPSPTSSSTSSAPIPAPAPVPTPTPSTSPAPAPVPAPSPTTPPPAQQPLLGITANAWVSNPAPNDRANETVYVNVKDNYGRPVTAASVVAYVYFKSGVQTYTLSSQGNGTYAVSFKLNEKYVADYRVAVEVTARYGGFSASAQTSFTPD